jgi:hypothetical protein
MFQRDISPGQRTLSRAPKANRAIEETDSAVTVKRSADDKFRVQSPSGFYTLQSIDHVSRGNA